VQDYLSDANRAINASGLNYVAPENLLGYSAGIGIFQGFPSRFCLEGIT
jgi:hypothetical protein